MSANEFSRMQRRADEMFAVAVASTAGMRATDNVCVYPKLVVPAATSKANPQGFNTSNLADAVNRLAGRRSFNIPAADMMCMVSGRTMANRGFAA